MNKSISIFAAASLFAWGTASAKHPACAGVDRWATQMAFGHLKDAGLVDDDRLDFSKTKTVRLASEKIGKDLYRQIHHVVFTERSGGTLEAITANTASSGECSMSGVDVFVISRKLGGK